MSRLPRGVIVAAGKASRLIVADAEVELQLKELDSATL